MTQPKHNKLFYFFSVIGPGLVVMLADTDAGSLITAAQSGAQWGYKLLLLQFILIPILYIVQELTVRLGLCTNKGHGELIKERYGKKWAYFSVATLLLSCFLAIISEFSGIVGVGELFSISPWVSSSVAAAFLIFIVLTGSYITVERVAILLGLFELVFFYIAYVSHPNVHEIYSDLKQVPFTNSNYLYLLVGNIGAVIMPWMIFYQQSSILDKGLTYKDIKIVKIDTLIGAIVTQLIMAATLVAVAATIGKANPNTPLDNISQISNAIVPFLGVEVGKTIFALGMLGASMIAAIVVSLTASWAVGEVLGYKRSLQDHPKEAPAFYILYIVFVLIGVVVVASGKFNLVDLNIAIEVINAILLPVTIGFLLLLAKHCLPEEEKLKGLYEKACWVIFGVLSIFGVIGMFAG